MLSLVKKKDKDTSFQGVCSKHILLLYSRWTQQVIIDTGGINELNYSPGDHVAILPANRKELIDAVLARLDNCPNPDEPIQVQVQKEVHSLNGRDALLQW